MYGRTDETTRCTGGHDCGCPQCEPSSYFTAAELSARALLEAARGSRWFDASECDAITPELLRAIATKLASHAFYMGPEIWDSRHAKLQRAWDDYRAHDAYAEKVDEAAALCPF